MPIPAMPSWQLRSIATSDVEDQAEWISGWSQRYHQLSAGPFQGGGEYIELPGLHLFFETFNRRVHQAGTPPAGCLALSHLLTTVEEGWLCGEPVGSSAAVLLQPRSEFHFRTPIEATVATVVLDASLALQIADEIGLREPLDRALGSKVIPLPAASRQALCDAVHKTRELAHTQAASLASEAGCRQLGDELLSRWLLVLCGEQGAVVAPPRNRRQRQRIVAEAYRYVTDNLRHLPTVLDICRHVQVNQRVLEYCFQEAFGLTPIAYLRHLRLQEVRRALRAGGEDGQTIGDVAAEFGFWHLGRFSSDYKKLFGELPSVTRRIGAACADAREAATA